MDDRTWIKLYKPWKRPTRKIRLLLARDELLVRLILDLGFASVVIRCLRDSGVFPSSG